MSDWVEAELVEEKVDVVLEKDKAELAPHAPRQLTEAEEKHIRLRTLEDDMLEDSLEVVRGVLRFADLDVDADGEPIKPEGWDDKKFRLAKAGLMNAKEAPVGIKIAAQTSGGIIKARSAEKGASRTLNVIQVKFATRREEYPSIEVDE